jgi:hypothetical protein
MRASEDNLGLFPTFSFTSINAYPTEACFLAEASDESAGFFCAGSLTSTEAYPIDACFFAVACEDRTGLAFGFIFKSKSSSSIVERSDEDVVLPDS